MADAAAPAPPIVVGRVRKPHGLKGELAIFPLTDDPEAVFRSGRRVQLIDLGGTGQGELVITQARIYHRECLLRFEGHESRNAVEQYRGLFLAVPREELAPLAEGEVYVRDLIGWAVRNEADEPLGLVTEVFELPQGPAVEVQGPKREFLVPMQGGWVQVIDRDTRRLVVRLPDGLLE